MGGAVSSSSSSSRSGKKRLLKEVRCRREDGWGGNFAIRFYDDLTYRCTHWDDDEFCYWRPEMTRDFRLILMVKRFDFSDWYNVPSLNTRYPKLAGELSDLMFEVKVLSDE